MISWFFIVLLILSVESSENDPPKDGKDDGKTQINKRAETADEKYMGFKKELIGLPFWKKLVRFPYKTCSNWADIQRNQTDFVSERRDCVSNCYLDDQCSGVLIVISQSRGCRYLSGMCESMESYEFEYFHKPVAFTKAPFLIGLNDRSVRWVYEIASAANSRCWLYRVEKDTCAESQKELNDAREKTQGEGKPPGNVKVAGKTKDLPLTQQAIEGKITGAFSIGGMQYETQNYVYFDLLPQDVWYEGWCANSAGFYSNPICFQTPKFLMEYFRHEGMGCQDTLDKPFSIGYFTKVGLLFCREMATRRKAYSFMYGRPDGPKGGVCILSKSCGRRIVEDTGDLKYFNTYTQFNMDFEVIKASSKCTPSPNKNLMPSMSLGSGYKFPTQCRKACMENIACEYFLYGKAGASEGSCMKMNSDCKSFEYSPRYDVWQLTRLEFGWFAMEAECLGATLYISDEMDFKTCLKACQDQITCNFFIRADIDNLDRGLCIGSTACDKTRPVEGFYIYILKVPPPLFMEEDERKDAKHTGRGDEVGSGEAKKEGRRRMMEVGYGMSPRKKNMERATLREMIHASGLRHEEIPTTLKIPILPRRLEDAEVEEKPSFINTFPDVAFAVISNDTFIFYSFPVIFGALFGAFTYIYYN